MIPAQRFRAFAKTIYHRLPLSQRIKWRLRERLQPLLSALTSKNVSGIAHGFMEAVRYDNNSSILYRDYERERSTSEILQRMATHARNYGPVSHWIALPFLATGGAEMVALTLCRALRQLRPNYSIALLITDRNIISNRMKIPEGVQLIVFDELLGEDLSYIRKKALLRDLLIAAQPECFHNINSEVAWHLIMEEGDRLKLFTKLFASIFAFQFSPDGHKKIGYAAYFLKQSLPHLEGLLSDNQRFVDDAAVEYALTKLERTRMAVLYQPCRLLNDASFSLGNERLARYSKHQLTKFENTVRPEILWAGRLDSEKKIELFLDIVHRCTFANFRVFGQVVMESNASLPALPNLSYEGPFSSPIEWIEKFDFDAFVFTSRWEGMPNILIEVGALGIPIIAPTVGGVGELVTLLTGYPLPEQPSVDDYEGALRAVLGEPLEAWERASRMLSLIQQRHSWQNFIATLTQIPGYVKCTSETPDITMPVVDCEQMQPLVSVIIPCYNQAQYLHQSISSVIAACRYPMEIIVVDDGSTDQRTSLSLAEIQRIAPDIYIHRQVNQGLSAARNKGISLARGSYIQFLDADDVLTPDKIDTQIAQFQINSKIDVSVCNFLLCDESRSYYSKPEEAIAYFNLTEQDFLYRWERGFAIPIHCGLFKRQILSNMSFDTSIRAKEDWLFWTSLVLAGNRFGYIHKHGAIYRQHEASMRRSNVNMGRSWLQAGLKIESMLNGREPLFFESVISWFDQCYRSSAGYRAEIMAIRESQADQDMPSMKPLSTVSSVSDMAADMDEMVHSLSKHSSITTLPFISVVVPIYGHYDYLRNCLMSLTDQGNVSFEIICIDDASPDQRISMMMNLLKDRLPRLKIIQQSCNTGISAVQNSAVAQATGDYIAFLDCDDELVSGALEVVSNCLKLRPEVDYIFTDRIDIDKNGNSLRVAHYGGYENILFSTQNNVKNDLLDGMVASHLKVIRRSVYLELGGSNPEFSGVQDWDLALKIGESHHLYYLAQPLYRHRTHEKSVTNSDMVAQFRKTNQVRRHYAVRWLRNSYDVNIGRNKVKVFPARNFPISLYELKECWVDGFYCVADASGALSIEQINFLREFNSYFDSIIWSYPETPSSLYGYLCLDNQLIAYNKSDIFDFSKRKHHEGFCNNTNV